MQALIKSSKFVLLVVLSFSLVIIWNLHTTEISSVNYVANPTFTEESSAPTGDSVWSSISRDLKLDHQTQSSQVQAEIHKLLADQGKLYSILKAAVPYIYFIHEQTQARGLPGELALIPAIESEFNPNDHSKKGATGLWQLMPATAHDLGVKVKSKYDGRRNVVASTKAALAYFNDLGNDFKGDWYLAIAAYNCGQVRVASAERRTGCHNFWKLPLPKETKYYVPKLLAVAAIVANPEKYGVQLPPVNNTPYFAQLQVQEPINLTHVAETSGISLETLHTLNPDYNHGRTPPKEVATLLVPIRQAPKVKAVLPHSVIVS